MTWTTKAALVLIAAVLIPLGLSVATNGGAGSDVGDTVTVLR